MTLSFTTRWRDELPATYTALSPTPLKNARLIWHNDALAEQLAIPAALFDISTGAGVWGGESLLPGMSPLAQVYSGHQFGVWAGQLGDGRGILLGEQQLADGSTFDWHLKGAGLTPYSRMGDGRAVLRSTIRESLASEAMHYLGIPTTRALSIVTSDTPVYRETVEAGAMLIRVAQSHMRFGHFEHFYYRREPEKVRQLADFAIRHYWPQWQEEADKYQLWFNDVVTRTATLIADWQAVGFAHGVMNTDNMSILGLTIDYGPYGWIDNFDLHWTPNTTDAEGLRYCFGRQPAIARWNLQRLAEALGTVITDHSMLSDGLAQFDQTFAQAMGDMLAAKLGLTGWHESDSSMVDQLFALMTESEVDMTIFFRHLADLDVSAPDLSVLRPAFYDSVKMKHYRERWDAWFAQYCQRVMTAPFDIEERKAVMNRTNPCYVLRNYLAQQAIDAATTGDYQPLQTLMQVMREPYQERPEWASYAEKRPDWAKQKAGCSMLSCSS